MGSESTGSVIGHLLVLIRNNLIGTPIRWAVRSEDFHSSVESVESRCACAMSPFLKRMVQEAVI